MVLSGQLNTGQGTQNEALKCIQIVSTGKTVSSSENDEGFSFEFEFKFSSFCLVAREEKALGIMAQKFLMLFLTSDVRRPNNFLLVETKFFFVRRRIESLTLFSRPKFFWAIRKTKSPSSVVTKVKRKMIAETLKRKSFFCNLCSLKENEIRENEIHREICSF